MRTFWLFAQRRQLKVWTIELVERQHKALAAQPHADDRAQEVHLLERRHQAVLAGPYGQRFGAYGEGL